MNNQAIDVVRNVVALVWNDGDLQAADSYFPADFPNGPHLPPGPEGVKEWHRQNRAAFPDVRYTIEDIFADGNKVALRWTATGTHLGQWGTLAPTGNTVTWTGQHIFECRDGQIVALWSHADILGKLQQVGVQIG